MGSWIGKFFAILSVIYLLANSSWIHAASYALVSEPCSKLLISSAHGRVTALYGNITSEPIFVCTTNPNNWLNVEYGQTNFSAGLPPAIRIGPKGMNVDVIAHEWAHAELFQRVGFFAREIDIPTWFDEGLAMQVDHRSDYDSEALESYKDNANLRKPVKSIIGTSDFFTEGSQGKYHYALSRCLVAVWLQTEEDYRSTLNDLSPEKIDSIYYDGNRICGA